MLLSVVSGTFNRLASLSRMVESVRRAIPRGLSYEIIVTDGGSTDLTLEWCRQQHDIRLIEHGELRGAIKAFCDGAKAARGEYVVLANDDITFRPNSIIAALSHLERTPSCGAVAFADNRTSTVQGNGSEYRVEGVGATTHDGREVMVAYAQVGMFRRKLGDLALWWGADDPVMSQARTYGGDNYLSARIWEMGYSVDPVEQAVCEDYIARDSLRESNNGSGPTDSRCYYQCFPTVKLPEHLKRYAKEDRLRIMCLPIYEPNYPGELNREYGLTEALAKFGVAFEIDYVNDDRDLVELCKAWQPDLLVAQIQGPSRITPYILANMRNAAPNMVIVNWNGDAHEEGLTAPVVVELLRYVDLQTTINAKVLPEYEALGIRAAYWQIGYKDPVGLLPNMPAYDVLFQGNCYDPRREALVGTLRSLFVDNWRRPHVGIYGNCQGADGNTHYDFSAQRTLYSRATIVVGDTYPNTRAFVSNRLFQALAAGAFLLQQISPDLDAFTGLQDGVHYVSWSDLPDLRQKIAYWLSHDEERQRIAQAGCAFVRENFSYDAQARKLFTDLLPMLEAERETIS